MLQHIMLVPYTDVTLWPTFDISTAPAKNYLLGFVVAGFDSQPSWGGYHKTTSDFYLDTISKVRKNGGDVFVSFGGASGRELATVIQSREQLFLAYKQVVDKYKLKQIDLDIEGLAIYDKEACQRRGAAIRDLINVYPSLKVSLTLPVMPSGLNEYAVACMKVTPHDILNVMAMDFGNEQNMGTAVISALQSVRKQTKKKIGVTVMIGVNDTGEVFTLKDAVLLKNFARDNPWVARISFWSIERDLGTSGSLAHSSQISQKRFEFSNLLK